MFTHMYTNKFEFPPGTFSDSLYDITYYFHTDFILEKSFTHIKVISLVLKPFQVLLFPKGNSYTYSSNKVCMIPAHLRCWHGETGSHHILFLYTLHMCDANALSITLYWQCMLDLKGCHFQRHWVKSIRTHTCLPGGGTCIWSWISSV